MGVSASFCAVNPGKNSLEFTGSHTIRWLRCGQLRFNREKGSFMDMIFNCSNCKQQLEADSLMAGSEISCPSCNEPLTIPEPNPTIVRSGNPIASSAAAKEEHHFQVPLHEGPSEVLIEKARPPLEVAAREGDRKIRVRTIRRTDCVEVGKDRFDEIVSELLQDIGETNIISITPIAYTHLDLGSRQLMTDFGVMIVYKG
jgi:hypothetical protein